MTLSNNDCCDFLNIHYEKIEIYINKSQLYSSIMLNEVKESGLQNIYFQKIIQLGDQEVVLFDLNAFIHSNFQAVTKGSVKLCFISDVSTYNRAIKEYLKSDIIACLIPSSSEIKSIALRELKLLPHVVSEALEKKGIIACSLYSHTISYLIDLEKVLSFAINTKVE